MIKLQALRLQRRCLSVKFEKFLRTSSLQNTSGGCFFKCNDCGLQKVVLFGRSIITSSKPSSESNSNDHAFGFYQERVFLFV